ncbi:MAG TPA: hypothetical protein VFK96_01210 [Gammaproteobacteria bacterium]|jgi:hypothetical protein|nr:hypothetical protein [Gammaproteobacteria bacterium]
MKRPVKMIIGVVIAILIVLGIIFWLVWASRNTIIASAIENYGPKLTGTSVSVGKVDLSLGSGTVELHNLTIGNPQGYQSDYALKLKDIKIGLDISSLTSNTIVMNEGIVDGASVNAEFRNGKSNLQQIMDNLQQFIGPSKPNPQQPATQKKFIVKTARFTNGKAAVMLDKANVNRSINIPDISIHDIGVKTNGVDAAELARQLLQPIIQRVLDAARGQVKQKAEKALQNKEDELKQKAKKKLQDKLKQLGQPPA